MTASPDDESRIPTTLLGQLRKHRGRYLAGLLLLAVYQYSQYWFDTRLQAATDLALGRNEAAIALAMNLLFVAVGAFGIRVLSRVAIFNAGRVVEYDLRRGLLFRLHKLGQAFYGRMNAGEIMSRATNDLTQVRMLFGFGILNALNTVLALVSALSVTLRLSLTLTLISSIPLVFLILVMRRFSREMFGRTRANQDATGKLSARVQSSISGIRVVKAFGLEPHELELFDTTNADYLRKSLSLARLRGTIFPVIQAFTALGTLVVFWYGGLLVARGELTAGGFLAFFRALGRLSWPLMALGFLISLVQRGRASFSRLEEVFDAKPDIVDGELPAPTVLDGKLEVRKLSFAYGERRVLDDVSFTLEPGRSLAIVGKTASGKSTLAALLPRLLAAPRGSILLDGRDICDLPLKFVRGAIGYAEQTPFLFSTSAGRNIGFSLDDPDSETSLETIRLAAERAGVLEELTALPDGLDTVVGERGVQLSGGQKQRVALARAFASTPKILVLDDPLSAVDARTEQRILDGIDAERHVRNLILVTHRVAAAARCDHVIVLDQGRIVESGTHQELLGRKGLYASFAEEQRSKVELEALSAAASTSRVEQVSV
jgi:ATP-binding cassette, subfamily B, multidrug efflux pump